MMGIRFALLVAYVIAVPFLIGLVIGIGTVIGPDSCWVEFWVVSHPCLFRA